MPKKNKKDQDTTDTSSPKDTSKDKKKKKKGGILLVIIFLFIMIAGAIAAIVIFNPLGIRDNYLANIPVVGDLLVGDADEEEEAVSRTNAELEQELAELNAHLETLNEELEHVRSANELYLQEISSLREIEAQQIQFREDRAEFDRMLAEGDPEAFKAFYENMSPENAATLYQEAVVTVAQTQELTEYVRTVRSMESDSAASMLEAMIETEIELVVLILNNIDSSARAAVLSEMTSQNAATVFALMAPEQQE